MSNIIEQRIGQFLIRAEQESGVSVFVFFGDEVIFCDNFDHNLHAAKEYIKRNSKGKIKVVNGEFYSK